MVDFSLHIETDVAPDELRKLLSKWQPFRHEIVFSNGIRTSDFVTARPFTRQPLRKVKLLEGHLPMEELRGGSALDVGFNRGYNSIYLAQEYQMHVTGIETRKKHLEVAEFLGTQINQGSVDFLIDDATTFHRPEAFDLILHFGTLYHLANPLFSLENTAKNLKPGGYLGLETSSYNGDDPTLCRFIRGVRGDVTNFWALSKKVIAEILEMYGFADILLTREVVLKNTEPGLSRVVFVARKKS